MRQPRAWVILVAVAAFVTCHVDLRFDDRPRSDGGGRGVVVDDNGMGPRPSGGIDGTNASADGAPDAVSGDSPEVGPTPDVVAAPADVESPSDLAPCTSGHSCGFDTESCSRSSCQLECQAHGHCAGSCSSACSAECEGDSECTVTAGDTSNLRCDRGAHCTGVLGADSSGSCGPGSTCTIRCLGHCTINCAGGAKCALACGAVEAPHTFTQTGACP